MAGRILGPTGSALASRAGSKVGSSRLGLTGAVKKAAQRASTAVTELRQNPHFTEAVAILGGMAGLPVAMVHEGDLVGHEGQEVPEGAELEAWAVDEGAVAAAKKPITLDDFTTLICLVQERRIDPSTERVLNQWLSNQDTSANPPQASSDALIVFALRNVAPGALERITGGRIGSKRDMVARLVQECATGEEQDLFSRKSNLLFMVLPETRIGLRVERAQIDAELIPADWEMLSNYLEAIEEHERNQILEFIGNRISQEACDWLRKMGQASIEVLPLVPIATPMDQAEQPMPAAALPRPVFEPEVIPDSGPSEEHLRRPGVVEILPPLQQQPIILRRGDDRTAYTEQRPATASLVSAAPRDALSLLLEAFETRREAYLAPLGDQRIAEAPLVLQAYEEEIGPALGLLIEITDQLRQLVDYVEGLYRRFSSELEQEAASLADKAEALRKRKEADLLQRLSQIRQALSGLPGQEEEIENIEAFMSRQLVAARQEVEKQHQPAMATLEQQRRLLEEKRQTGVLRLIDTLLPAVRSVVQTLREAQERIGRIEHSRPITDLPPFLTPKAQLERDLAALRGELQRAQERARQLESAAAAQTRAQQPRPATQPPPPSYPDLTLELEGVKRQARERIGSLEETNRRLQAEVTRLEQVLASAAEARVPQTRVVDPNPALQAQIAHLQQELDEARRKNGELRTKHAQSQALAAEKEAEIEELKGQLGQQ